MLCFQWNTKEESRVFAFSNFNPKLECKRVITYLVLQAPARALSEDVQSPSSGQPQRVRRCRGR